MVQWAILDVDVVGFLHQSERWLGEGSGFSGDNGASCDQHPTPTPRGAADAEIKVPSVENTQLEGSPFKASGRGSI